MSFSANSSPAAGEERTELGYLDLQFAHRAGRTVITKRRYTYPFSLSRAFYLDAAPQGMASVILQTASGTLNAGDQVRQRLHACAGSAVHLATQGATAVYRAPGKSGSVDRVELVADDNALLEYMPEIRILFPDADLLQATTLVVGSKAVIITCDGAAVHDPSGSSRHFRSYRVQTRIVSDEGRLLAVDASQAAGFATMSGGRGRFRAFGTLFVVTTDPSLATAALQALLEDEMRREEGLYWSVCSLPNGCGLSIRMAGQDGGALRAGIRAGWLAARRHFYGDSPGIRHKAG